MNWAWATSLEQLWRSPVNPAWLILVVAGFFAVLLLLTLLRADRSLANGALAMVALLAVGTALASFVGGGFGSRGPAVVSGESRSAQLASLPALSCIDELAGDLVLSACERALFGSAETTAAAVSYAASQLSRLTALTEIAAAGNRFEMESIRRAIEQDRYGLMAHVLVARDHCTSSNCAVFEMLTDHQHLAANMDQRTYEQLLSRYAPLWNAPGSTPASSPVALLPPSLPTGKPTNAEFPTAASTPAVSIMTPEPPISTAPPSVSHAAPRPAPASAATAPRPSPPRPPSTPAPAVASAKKQVAPKLSRPASEPVQLTPSAPAGASDTD